MVNIIISWGIKTSEILNVADTTAAHNLSPYFISFLLASAV